MRPSEEELETKGYLFGKADGEKEAADSVMNAAIVAFTNNKDDESRILRAMSMELSRCAENKHKELLETYPGGRVVRPDNP